MMSLITEFKAFIQRGNVIDLAVAVIIGAAFGKIVSSLVSDVITPLLGIAPQGGDVLSALDIPLYQGAKIKVGAFLQSVIDFLIISFCVFMLVKGVNAIHLEKVLAGEPKPAEMTTQEKLLTEIRDLLKAQQQPDNTIKTSPEERPG
jgi:large conductance mechanosensitive channel